MELRSVPQSRGPTAGGLRLPESLLHRAREMLRVAGWRCWAPAWGDAPTQTPFCWCEWVACHCCCCVGRHCVCKYHVLGGDLVIIQCTSEPSDRSRHLCFSMWVVEYWLPAWAWWTWSHFVLDKLCEGLPWPGLLGWGSSGWAVNEVLIEQNWSVRSNLFPKDLVVNAWQVTFTVIIFYNFQCFTKRYSRTMHVIVVIVMLSSIINIKLCSSSDTVCFLEY